VGIDYEEALGVDGVFDLFALNEQAPPVPGVFFAGGVEGAIAFDLEDVGIDGVARASGFEVRVGVYGGVGGDAADFPLAFLGGGAEQ